MGKTYRFATTQCSFGWPIKPQYNPYDEHFRAESVSENVENSVALQLKLFEEAGRQGADLVLGAEDMQRLGHYGMYLRDPGIFRSRVETIPGPTSRRIARVARKYRMYIVACYPEKAGRLYYNTAVLFGRTGRILGKYRKVQLPAGENWVYRPGRSFPVFRTELGNIGIAICYDIMFPEIVRCLALNGADLICHPTMGYGWTEEIGEATVKSRCVDNGVHIIVSCGKRSQVVDPWGRALCDAGTRKNVVVSADVDLAAGQVQPPNHYGSVLSGIRDLRERWTKERQSAGFGVLSARRPPLMKRYSPKFPPSRPEEIRKVFEAYEQEQIRIARGLAAKYTW